MRTFMRVCVHADLRITEPATLESAELLMETLSEPMKITISENTYQQIKDDFVCSERGEFEVKGFGMNNLYYLERELP